MHSKMKKHPMGAFLIQTRRNRVQENTTVERRKALFLMQVFMKGKENMKLNHNYDGKTRLRHWHPIVKENFKAIEEHANSVDASIEGYNDHRTASELDHPDNSVTDAKIGLRTIPNPKKKAGDIIGNLTTLLHNIVEAHRSEVSERENADTALGNNKVDKTKYASVSQAGVIMLYNKNGVNRSGLVVYDDGSVVVNTKAEHGITRDGAGQIGINPATEAEITAGTDAYKPIVPATLSHAVQSVMGELTGLETHEQSSLVSAINEINAKSAESVREDVFGYIPSAFLYPNDSAEIRIGVTSVSPSTSGNFYFNGLISSDDLENAVKMGGKPVGVSIRLYPHVEFEVSGVETDTCVLFVIVNVETLEIEEAVQGKD